jgi:hypothetical protein
MATVLLPSDSAKQRTHARVLAVALTVALLTIATSGLIVVNQSGIDPVTAGSVEITQQTAAGQTTGLSESRVASVVSDVPFASDTGCDANGIAGDLVGNASPHEVFKAYFAMCSGQ